MEDSTKAIRDQMERTVYREHSAPMFLTSSFVYSSAEHAAQMFAGDDEGDIYSRFTNPNTTELIRKFCSLEKAEAGVVTASGMAAIFACLATHLHKGDRVVASNALFGNSLYILTQILPSWGIECILVPVYDEKGWEQAITPSTKMVLIETPTNPGLDLIDIEWLADLCKINQAILCVDNCFATPILQKPMNFGADLVLHSATKWIDGQGRILGGIVVGHEEYIDPIFDFLRRTGSCLSPFNAWMLSKSTETLEVRMTRHCENALTLAKWFEEHQMVKKVRYPHLASHPQIALAKKQMTMGGGIITIDLDTDQAGVFTFINHLKIPTITANLGDARSIITHPATTTHSKLSKSEQEATGIYSSTVRLSIGLEHSSDLIDDFEQALNTVR